MSIIKKVCEAFELQVKIEWFNPCSQYCEPYWRVSLIDSDGRTAERAYAHSKRMAIIAMARKMKKG
jgi:hypothetical protein